MNKNKLLNQASSICSVFSFVLSVGILVGTLVLIHWHFDKAFYNGVKVTEYGYVYYDGSVSSGKEMAVNSVAKSRENKAASGELTLDVLKPFTIYMLYLQGIARMFFLLLIVREFRKIVKSVKGLQTFRTENILSFRKIGKYFLIVFWFSVFRFMPQDGAAQVSFDFDITPLILMLAAYILAEIFREGNRLYEEEQLTV